ncbi:MAG: HAMP domain-containing protein [Treponema sp.]|jgi:adenylate cyclase|nr:HAMP domain-containing protein [Treponema sp.]
MMLVVSMGLFTLLMSYLVTNDVQVTAKDNNESINRKTSAAVNAILEMIHFDTLIFLNNIELLSGKNDKQDVTIQAVETYLFNQKKEFAAVILIKKGEESSVFINQTFFNANEIDASDITDFMVAHQDEVLRSINGQVLMRNTGKTFPIPILAMFSPLEKGQSVAVVFLSVENLTENFSSGANSSFMIDEEGNLLIHSDQDLIKDNKNLKDIAFVKAILNSNREIDEPYIDENGIEYFAAFQKVIIDRTVANATIITLIEREVVFEGIQMTTTRNIYLSIAILFLAILFVYHFSNSLSSSLHRLSDAALKIENGRYDLNLTVKTSDETGVLTESFITMGYALENFERFTNKAIVAMARKGKLSLGGVYKIATVCFAFIRDFSEMMEDYDAQEVVEFVNDYLKLMVPCITATNGEVDKFLTQGGVIIMALWGTLESEGAEKDALNCIKSVLMMRSCLRSLNEKRLKQGKPLIKIGNGINTGELVSGQMGSNERMEYTVIGDTVNFAARVEGPNDAFDTDILITENTWNRIGEHLVTEEMPGFEVKGKEKPVRVFAVVNIKDEEESTALFQMLQTIPDIDMNLAKRCVGNDGPKTLTEVRERWRS